MRILTKYVLREHIGPLVFALSALTTLLLLNQVAKQFGNLVGKGLSWGVIGEFFLLTLPFIIAMTLPMAVLVAVLFAFSRFSAENEVTALRASGVSMMTLVRPVLIAGVLTALANLLFNDQVLPRANHRLRSLQTDIARKKPTFALRAQVINEVMPGPALPARRPPGRGDERDARGDDLRLRRTRRGARRSTPTAGRWGSPPTSATSC